MFTLIKFTPCEFFNFCKLNAIQEVFCNTYFMSGKIKISFFKLMQITSDSTARYLVMEDIDKKKIESRKGMVLSFFCGEF